MLPSFQACSVTISRTPRGVRGLKSCLCCFVGTLNRRTPRGVRGLKLLCVLLTNWKLRSHPSRGAWIEIPLWQNKTVDEIVAPLAGCVD